MDAKPYGVTAERLWLEAHLSRFDPKIGEPYASQIVKEIDAYVARSIKEALWVETQRCAEVAADVINGARGSGDNDLRSVRDRVSGEILDRIKQ